MRYFDGNIVIEGTTNIWLPYNTKTKKSSDSVFYNPFMELNRDLSILFLKAVSKERYTFLDALAGTGARGVRVANEVGLNVTMNDVSNLAYEVMKKNAELNNLNVDIRCGNAKVLLAEESFDIVDIDPFGSPISFIDDACCSAKKFLCITATDTASLVGSHPPSCLRKYFAKAFMTDFYPEIGVRILIGAIARISSVYVKSIEPLFSHCTRHYIRTYLQIVKGKEKVNSMLNDKIGFILYCKNCLNRDFSYGIVPSPENVCPYCGGRMYAIGPLWIGELHDKEIIGRMLQEIDHIRLNTDRESRKLLEFCKDELLVPGFYDYHSIAKVHKIKLEPIRSVISNLVSAGYNASRTHFMGTGIKTDANIYELLKVIKR